MTMFLRGFASDLRTLWPIKQRAQGERLIAQGDEHRSKRDWPSAAESYAAALHVAPDNAAIWVQLGHALKESGRKEEARESYLKALRLQPHNSDTALQLGHVNKLLGRRDEAAEWYAKATIWKPLQHDAIRELEGLELTSTERSGLMINSSAAEQKRNVQEGAILWDVTPAWKPAECRTPTDAWWFIIGVELWKRGLVLLCRYEHESDIWIQIASPQTIGSRGSISSRESEKLIPANAAAMFAQIGPTESEATCAALTSFKSQNGIPIVAHIPSADQWSAALSRPESENVLAALDRLLMLAGVVTVTTASDRALISGRAAQVRAECTVELLSLGRPDRQATAAHQKSGADFILGDFSDDFLAWLRSAHVKANNGRALVVLKEHDLIESCISRNADQFFNPTSCFPPDNASTVIVSVTSPGSEAWIAASCDTGAPVAVTYSERIYSLFGRSVSRYLRGTSEHEVISWWREALPSAPNTVQVDRWSRSFETIASKVKAHAPKTGKLVLTLNQFYSAGQKGALLQMRHGRGCIQTLPFFSVISGGEEVHFSFQIDDYIHDGFTIVVLAGGPLDRSLPLKMVLRSKDHGWSLEKVTSGRGWGWLSLSVSTQIVEPIDYTLTVSSGGGSPFCIGGIFAFRNSNPSNWFNFLDQVSRNAVAEVRAVRNWGHVAATHES